MINSTCAPFRLANRGPCGAVRGDLGDKTVLTPPKRREVRRLDPFRRPNGPAILLRRTQAEPTAGPEPRPCLVSSVQPVLACVGRGAILCPRASKDFSREKNVHTASHEG